MKTTKQEQRKLLAEITKADEESGLYDDKVKTPVQKIFEHLKASKENDSFGEVYCVDWLLENEELILEEERKVMFLKKVNLVKK